MKKNILFQTIICLMVFALSSCLHEYPELTSDGKNGIDPTEVMVTADIVLDMQLSEAEHSRIASRNAEGYRHRFIIEAYLNRDVAERVVVYAALTDNNRMNVPVTMKLNARDYQLVVWSDYILTENEDDLFYKTDDLISVSGINPYRGNTEFKDVQIASVPLELSQYRKEWDAKVPVRVNLERPTAHYKLVATDVERYLNRYPEAAGKRYTVTIKYEDYLPIGYNAYDGVPKHSFMYMQYNNVFTMPQKGTFEIPLTFDYLFASDDKPYQHISIEIKNEAGTVVANTTNLTVNYSKGKSVIIKGAFLTNQQEPGVGIDPGFDGEKEIETEVTFL